MMRLNGMFLKCTCSLFIVYYCLIDIIFPSTAFLLTPMCGLMMMVVFINICQNREFVLADITLPIAFWIMFGATSYITSIFTAADVSLALDSAFTFIKLTSMCFCVVYISKETRDYEFLVEVMYIISLIYAIYMLSRGNYKGIRLTIGNANTDANVCLIGMVTASWVIIHKKNAIIKALLIGSIIFFVYVNLMTGSRKSFLCFLFYILGWGLIELKPLWKQENLASKIIVFIIFFIGSFIVYKFIWPVIVRSSTYARLISDSAHNENEIRISLYKEAWQYFKSSPVFGIGYNQFRIHNSKGMYSHSTYAEIAADCGIVGIIMFFTPHVWSFINLIKIKMQSARMQKDKMPSLVLLYLMSTFILATGMVQTNNERVLLMYSIIFSYIISNRNGLTSDFENYQKRYKMMM